MSSNPRLGLWYLGVGTITALALVAALRWRGQPPPPSPPGPAVPSPEALSPEDRADFERAVDAARVVVGAALLTRVWRYQPPEPGGWPEDGAAAEAARAGMPEVLKACGWEGALRALDCRRPPCVAHLTGEALATCAAWPEGIQQSWTPPIGSAEPGD